MVPTGPLCVTVVALVALVAASPHCSPACNAPTSPASNVSSPSSNVSIPEEFDDAAPTSPASNVSSPSNNFSIPEEFDDAAPTSPSSNVSSPSNNFSIPEEFDDAAPTSPSSNVSSPASNVSIPEEFDDAAPTSPSSNVSSSEGFDDAAPTSPSSNVSNPEEFDAAPTSPASNVSNPEEFDDAAPTSPSSNVSSPASNVSSSEEFDDATPTSPSSNVSNPEEFDAAPTSPSSNVSSPSNNVSIPEEFDRRAAAFLAGMEQDAQTNCNAQVKKTWNYYTNLTDHNQKIMNDGRQTFAKAYKERWARVIQWNKSEIQDPLIRRQFLFLSYLGSAALPDDKFMELNSLQSKMSKIYGSAKICSYEDPDQCDLRLDEEIHDILTKSRSPKELEHIWLQWREESGKKMRENFIQFAALIDDSAKANNYTDGTAMWLDEYDAPDFRQQLAALWEEVAPLYRQLHAFVRSRLRAQYGEQVVSRNGPIPAHLLGDMWAQSWSSLFDIFKPFPNRTGIDVSEQMKEDGYTPERMFRLSEEFFTSLGLEPMPDTFWNRSVLERPSDGRELVCHASAWDFCDQQDFRIKQCTGVTMDQLVTVHHEMGHIQYYMQYKDLPVVLRSGANSGFHEAVGDTLALSVQTPKHLKKLNLLKGDIQDPEVDMNFLMLTALGKVAFLPFGYLVDKWRWDIFSNVTAPEDLNCAWWTLREQLQGVKPPQTRSEADFDPGAKYHVATNTRYIRYFVAHILQFQFHKALCQAAGEYDPQDPSRPLHQCDIHNSKEAGKLLGDMLRLGSSVPWPDALEAITGQRKMDASALREYFAPLESWLRQENNRTGETVGWQSDGPVCVKTPQQ